MGRPGKHKVISRAVAYHGTPHGALCPSRDPVAQGSLRTVGTRGFPGPEHQRLPRSRVPARRREGLRTLGCGPHRGGHRVRGCRHGRRGVPRARTERGRMLPAPTGILRARPRDLRRARRAARQRRGDLRVRAHRRHVRLQRLWLRARHDHLREGHDVGLLADRRDDRVRPPLRAVLEGHDQVRPGNTFGGHPVSAAVAMANLDIFERGASTARAETAPAFRATLEKLLDLPIVGDVRGDGFFYGIEMVKDKTPARRSTTTRASGCCGGSSPRPSSRPGCTAGRTTAATPSCSSRHR